MANTTVTTAQVAHIAKLANLTVAASEQEHFAHAFSETLDVVETLKQLDTTGVEPTHQVTNLENIFREDVVDETRQFTQEQALANAKRTHAGYFVVERILPTDC